MEETASVHPWLQQKNLEVRYSMSSGSVAQPKWIEVAKILTSDVLIAVVVAFEKSICYMNTSVLPRQERIGPLHAICSMMGDICSYD